MSERLTGKIALVTGANGGIGAALVHVLAGHGATVIATSRRRQANGAASGPGAVHHRFLDVSQLDTLAPFVAQISEEFGSLDLLVPNAGIAPVRTLVEIDPVTWQDTLTVNLTAPFLLVQAALPGMVAHGYGRVLFTSSAAASWAVSSDRTMRPARRASTGWSPRCQPAAHPTE